MSTRAVREIYKGRVVHLVVEEVDLPNGNRVELEIIHHPGAAAVVPFVSADEVLLIRQYRHAAGGYILEVPAGKLDPGEAPEACALRETEEEIGLAPHDVVIVAELPPVDTQATGWRVHPFVGRVPWRTTWRLQESEIVGVLTPALRDLADPAARRSLPFTSLRHPEPLLVEGIELEGHVLWGMTLRLLDLVAPRLLAGEWELGANPG